MKTSPLTALISLQCILGAFADTIIVPGHADLWLAGTPSGTSLFSPSPPNDVAPDQWPVPSSVTVSTGDEFEFTVSGTVGYDPLFVTVAGDGAVASPVQHLHAATLGKSDIIAPISSLIGVFLNKDINLSLAQPTLDFSTDNSRNYSSLSPALGQTFFIGNGLTAGGLRQRFVAPQGANILWLGTMDSYGWWNNSGYFRVDVKKIGQQVLPDSLVLRQAVSLTMEGTVGNFYRVEQSDDMQIWTLASIVELEKNPMQIFFDTQGVTRKFYRTVNLGEDPNP